MAANLITVEIINFGEVCLAIGEKSIYVPTTGGASSRLDALRSSAHPTSIGKLFLTKSLVNNG
jgi:hypothetical protein